MAARLTTVRFGRITYFVERINDSEAYPLPVRFILYSPRGRRFLLVPDTRHRDRLVAIAPITHFSRFRPTPFGGVWFTVEDDGKLVVAATDA